VDRRRIVDGCDVALAALLYWQAVDEPRPATIIATVLHVDPVRSAHSARGFRVFARIKLQRAYCTRPYR
jgi:hypothetical protein